jgi:hypothetical protein
MQYFLIGLALVIEEKGFNSATEKGMLAEVQWFGDVDCVEEAAEVGILAQIGLEFTFPHLTHLKTGLFQLMDSMLGAEEQFLCRQTPSQFHLPMGKTYSASLKNEKNSFFKNSFFNAL